MFTLPLNSPQATLANTGGKGMNLAKLSRAGLPVPNGFLITTQAYQDFVAGNQLGGFIQQTIQQTNPDDPAALNKASSTIRARFSAGIMPDELGTAVTDAYKSLTQSSSLSSHHFSPVAVRSSATAEDLPDMSFAGQQDTFLNVVGEAALLKAVIDCWSSLWTARAIGYRARNGISHDEVSLAVVVQAMVPSEASGVLFTANPLNGRRTEMVIDATLGLGEALVSGQVEPDQYIIAQDGAILQKKIGAKATVIRGQAGGGTITEQVDGANRQAIPDSVIADLANLGRQIVDVFGFPQDIEWAWSAGKLYLLQSRPITSLFPIPEKALEMAERTGQLQIMFSFGAVQGMLDPMTPLGQDSLKGAMAGLSEAFGYHFTMDTVPVAWSAAERLWISITALMRHPIGRKAMRGFFPMVIPGAMNAIETLWNDPRLMPQRGWFRFRTIRQILRVFIPTILGMMRTMRHPDQRRKQMQHQFDDFFTQTAVRYEQAQSFGEQLAIFEEMMRTGLRYMLFKFLPVFGAGMGSLNLLLHLPANDGPNPLTITRGLPHNVTTEMDLALWQTAQAIRKDETAVTHFTQTDARTLSQEYLNNQLPAAAQTAVAQFLERYGMRGLAEIDLGRPRWRENPTHIMQSLQSYLKIDDPARAPDAVFARGAAEAEAAVGKLAAAVRQNGSRFKARLVPIAARRVRALAGLRETPKFVMIRMLGIARAAFLQSGQQMTAEGILAQPDDLFFFHLDELKALAAGEKLDWAALAAERRAVFAREKLRRQLPRLILSDGHVFYEGTATSASLSKDVTPSENGDLAGTPVSPGIVEGVVHIVLDPHDAQLTPGEILVCPGTDPSWTPLFLAAGGLITEVGGLMTHGSVVAREYGIPAVVGVDHATTRLQTGQRIRLDGSSGQIEVMRDEG
ncbi:MAG: phosphoenolpyruvate synthase [Ardenticatenaceae bacterium]|nr:phosphoenolpyruvate synthase [Ardenticatenaceae bacterium]MCB9444850.1 phosphoenolpyruvate synthase [Ardenticatenaceae bacterium]